jgi:hypothetical protein
VYECIKNLIPKNGKNPKNGKHIAPAVIIYSQFKQTLLFDIISINGCRQLNQYLAQNLL